MADELDPDAILAEGVEQQQEAPAPQADVYTPPTEQEMQEIANSYFALQQQLAAVNQAYQEAVQTRPEEEYDPNAIDDTDSLDPAQVRQMLREEIMAVQEEALQQNPLIQSVAEQRGAQIAEQLFEQWKPQMGEFDRTLALNLANAYGAQNPQLHPQQALYMGAQQAKQYGDDIRRRVAEEYEQNLKNRLEAPKQASQGAANAGTEARSSGKSYDEVTADFLSRRNLDLSAN